MQIFANPLIGLVVPVALLGIGAVTSMTDATRSDRQGLARSAAQQQVMAGLESQQQKAESALAVSRYQGACVWLDQGQVSEGLSLVTAEGTPLPEGTAICDSFGGTAVIKDGIAQSLARTSDQAVIRSFLGW
jgi:hypothetical protein